MTGGLKPKDRKLSQAGRRGGQLTASKLTPEQRRAKAQAAAAKRWGKDVVIPASTLPDAPAAQAPAPPPPPEPVAPPPAPRRFPDIDPAKITADAAPWLRRMWST